MSLALEIDPREFAAVEAALTARPEQARRALVRAINKTLQWARTQGLRAIARENDIPLKVLRGNRSEGRRGRGIVRMATRDHLVGIAWFGIRPIKASYLGKPRQTSTGARVGKRFFDGAFVATMPTGHIGIFRQKQPLTRMSKGRHGHSFNLPIAEEIVHLGAAARAIDGVKAQLADRLSTTFTQEMNFEYLRERP